MSPLAFSAWPDDPAARGRGGQARAAVRRTGGKGSASYSSSAWTPQPQPKPPHTHDYQPRTTNGRPGMLQCQTCLDVTMPD